MAEFFQEALASIGAAIADVREKVVEEGYFGRVVTNDSQAEAATLAKSNAFDECLAEKLQVADIANTDKTRDNPEPTGGMEH